MVRHVERDDAGGVAWLAARDGDVDVGVAGTLTREEGRAVEPDSVFRISSMTKPITAVAALILVEECRLRLDEPVDDLLPELAGRSVLVDGRGASTARPCPRRDPSRSTTSSRSGSASGWTSRAVAVAPHGRDGRRGSGRRATRAASPARARRVDPPRLRHCCRCISRVGSTTRVRLWWACSSAARQVEPLRGLPCVRAPCSNHFRMAVATQPFHGEQPGSSRRVLHG